MLFRNNITNNFRQWELHIDLPPSLGNPVVVKRCNDGLKDKLIKARISWLWVPLCLLQIEKSDKMICVIFLPLYSSDFNCPDSHLIHLSVFIDISLHCFSYTTFFLFSHGKIIDIFRINSTWYYPNKTLNISVINFK